ncbi:hypothetical protein D3C87_1446760 [compost metagenome]
MPAVDLAQRAAHERRSDHPGADAQVEDLEGVGAGVVLGRVQAADLDGDIALEAARADGQAHQRAQEGHVEGHQEMADGHQRPAQQDRPCPPQPAVGDQPAQNRRQIDQSRVDAEDRRGERLDRQRPIDGFQRAAEAAEAGDILDMPRLEQLADHVEDQQGLHAVVGEALPRLGEGQIPEADRMAEQPPSRRADGRRRGRLHPRGAGRRAHVHALGHDLLPAQEQCSGAAADVAVPVRTD